MIKKVDVTISFPIAARFSSNLDFYVYMKLLELIKKTNCINSQSKCKDCDYKDDCQYFKFTGKNFLRYSAIIMSMSYFSKLTFTRNEEKKFSFYLIGDSSCLRDYINILFENFFSQKICGNLFYLKSIKSDDIIGTEKVKKIKVKTVLENESSFSKVFNDMIIYYNENYNTEFTRIKVDTLIKNMKYVEMPEFKLGTKVKKPKGIIGDFIFQDIVEIPSFSFYTGIGKFNYIGGGEIEIEN